MLDKLNFIKSICTFRKKKVKITESRRKKKIKIRLIPNKEKKTKTEHSLT